MKTTDIGLAATFMFLNIPFESEKDENGITVFTTDDEYSACISTLYHARKISVDALSFMENYRIIMNNIKRDMLY